MPTKPLNRLMFIQGRLCFFCKQALPTTEASVEHLLAKSNGGNNSDENCVACCKSLNTLFGSMSLREKFQVVLNQKGQFKCPKNVGTVKTAAPLNDPSAVISQTKSKATPKTPSKAAPKTPPKTPPVVETKNSKLAFVIANLKRRGNSKPRSIKTLTSALASLYPKDMPEEELASLFQQLQSTGQVIVTEDKVMYAF